MRPTDKKVKNREKCFSTLQKTCQLMHNDFLLTKCSSAFKKRGQRLVLSIKLLSSASVACTRNDLGLSTTVFDQIP